MYQQEYDYQGGNVGGMMQEQMEGIDMGGQLEQQPPMEQQPEVPGEQMPEEPHPGDGGGAPPEGDAGQPAEQMPDEGQQPPPEQPPAGDMEEAGDKPAE